MTNEIPKADTYAVLEFQGFIADVPTYDRDTGRLEFVARALNRPTLKFFAQSELGKAFKSVLHCGRMVQVTAYPFPHIEEIGGQKVRVIDWEAKRIAVLGRRTTNLGRFSDVRILDGLMPVSGEIEDVGYVSPYKAERDAALKREREESEDDEDL